jgi:hypothetical protein
MSMAPLVCQISGPHGSGPDCPLWDARERIALRRSIEADSAARLGVSALVSAEISRGFRLPASPPTRPVPIGAPEKGALQHA